jgi:head-tail adaptor
MAAGELNKRIEILESNNVVNGSFVPTFSDAGEVEETFSLKATRWGKIEELSGIELIRAKAVAAEVSCKITLRNITDFVLTSQHKLRHNNKIYDIVAPIEQNNFLICMATKAEKDDLTVVARGEVSLLGVAEMTIEGNVE